MKRNTKIGLFILGGATIGIIAFYMIKNAKITRETSKAMAEGYKCGPCLASKIKRCEHPKGMVKTVNCGYRLDVA